MTLAITPLYALPIAIITLVLWFRVSSLRGALGVSVGDGGNLSLLHRSRQHGNCLEWSIFLLVLMMLAESVGTPAPWLHAIGALTLLGRLAHPFGLHPTNPSHPLRYLGNGTNLLAAALAVAALARHAVAF